MSGPPAHAKKAPSAFVTELLAKSVRPHAIIDFPMRDANGNAVAQVHVRGLSQGEQDLCFANARTYVARLTKGEEENKWSTEELEHNARASEILAIACRRVDDPTLPFFESGVVDTREFETEVLGQLLHAFNELKAKYYPLLNELDTKALEAWVSVISEGAQDLPFHSLSRETLEALVRSLVGSLVDARAALITMSTDSSSSDSSEQP